MSAKTVCSVLFFMATANAQAATPFTISGEKINAIFSNGTIWKKVSGHVKSIKLKKHTDQGSIFAIATTREPGGLPCEFLVKVSDVDDDGSLTDWQVTEIDFSGCPSASPRAIIGR